MSLMSEWTDLLQNQTDDTFEAFWKEYSEAEMKVYADILDNHKDGKYAGNFKEMQEKYEAKPVIYCGFLDGIQDSLTEGKLDMDSVDESTNFDFTIDFESLYYNMHKAEARHLYSLKAWDGVLSEEERAEIVKKYKRSKTVVKEKKIGRNDPCPCGSGKKYKHCCGRNA